MSFRDRINNDDDPQAIEGETTAQGTVAGCPGQNDKSNHAYESKHNKRFERAEQSEDNIPSAGWREVYYGMEVGQYGHQ